MHYRISIICCFSLVLIFATTPAPWAVGAQSDVLDTIRARGHINCGVSDDVTGFSKSDGSGTWSGMDIEFCAAVATAVFGKRDAVKYIPLTKADQIRALRAGDVDILPRNTSWTLSRDTELGVRYVGTYFYDGQGFLARRDHAITSVFSLSGASICLVVGTQSASALQEFFDARSMPYQLVTSENWKDLVEIYGKGGCLVLSADVSVLATARSGFSNPEEHFILPELITKEPMGPIVGAGDDVWFSVVRWTLMALIAAEELGLSAANISTMGDSKRLAIRRFIGLEAHLGAALGLSKDWAFQVVRQVGNYGEMFERNLGANSSLGLERGQNKLWNEGGLHYAAPFR